MIPFGLLIAIVLGLGWGSFATMAVYRIPNGEPWIGRKPYCPKCNHTLNFFDYVSIFSFFIHNGTCRYCGREYDLHLSYLFTEIACTILFIVAYMMFGFTEQFLLLTSIGITIIIMSAIEYEYRTIPNQVLISLLFFAIMHRVLQDGHLYGMLFGGFWGLAIGVLLRHLHFALRGEIQKGCDYLQYEPNRFSGEGFAYVKLLGVTGVFFEADDLFYVLLLSLFVGLIIHLTIRNRNLTATTIGFTMLGVLFDPGIIDWITELV